MSPSYSEMQKKDEYGFWSFIAYGQPLVRNGAPN